MKNQNTKVKSASGLNVIVWIYLLAFILMTWSFKSFAAKKSSEPKKSADPIVVIDTNLGKIKVKLNPKDAPISTENFLKYVDKKFYDKTVFHRVIKDFMIQGGGHTEDLKEKTVLFPAIQNEAKNGLSNKRGTLAMARTNEVNSATAQFFINVVDNNRLDHVSEAQYGYAVFGEVVDGMDVVDKIRNSATEYKNGMGDVPTKTIMINSIRKK